MIKEKDIDLLAIVIWKLKVIYKNYLIVLAGLVIGAGVGFLKFKLSDNEFLLKEKTFIIRSNLPNVGSLFKLSQTLLQGDKAVLTSILKLDDDILSQISTINLDTLYKPNLVLKISGKNEEALDSFKKEFVNFYNQIVKEDLKHEKELCTRIIKKFNLRTGGELLNDDKSNPGPISASAFVDKDQLEAYEKGLHYFRRKEAIERDGGLTQLYSFTRDVTLGGNSLTRLVFLYLIIGFVAGCALAILKEGWKLLKPMLTN